MAKAKKKIFRVSEPLEKVLHFPRDVGVNKIPYCQALSTSLTQNIYSADIKTLKTRYIDVTKQSILQAL